MRPEHWQDLTLIGRWKWAVLVALVAFPASFSSAAPEKYDFKLKMSQDKELCPAITKVLSATYSFDAPPSHDWFTAIQWQTLNTLGEQFRDEQRLSIAPCLGDSWATFDIDNDGQPEIVIKTRCNLGGIPSDGLLVFRSDEAREHIYQTLMDRFAPSDSVQGEINRERLIGTIDLTGETYELRKLPTFEWQRGRHRLHYISGVVHIHPFRVETHTFLSLVGLCCNEDGSAWHVIARLRPGEKTHQGLEELCYIRRLKR
jgi:hypothetical protein